MSEKSRSETELRDIGAKENQELSNKINRLREENKYILQNIINTENDLSTEEYKLENIRKEISVEEIKKREMKEDIEFIQLETTKLNENHNKLLSQLIDLLETNKKLKEKLNCINSLEFSNTNNQQQNIKIEDNEKNYI